MRVLIKNRRSIPSVRYALAAVVFLGPLHAGQKLPVFLSDNHAETFGWITREFDPDGRHQLVLVDAHSDASAAEHSDDMREGLRRVPSLAARAAVVEKWRATGRLQAFNWIEPLMPRPLERVCWLAAPTLTDDRRAKLTSDAVAYLDGRLEVESRSAGSFAGRWETLDLPVLREWKSGSRPIILAIDLDFFADIPLEKQESVFETIWQQAMTWPGLAGAAFSVSRPWLADDAQADRLVSLACGAVARTRGATLEIDASIDDRPDGSKRASLSSTPVARWDAEKNSSGLRARWLEMGSRLRITDRKRDWRKILDSWSMEKSITQLRPDHGEIDCDGVWRFDVGAAPVLRLSPPEGASGSVRWFALEHACPAYDLLPETGLGKSFSSAPGRWIYETRRGLGVTEDFALPPEKWTNGTAGRVRLEAEVETANGWLPVPPTEIRLTEGTGFRASLSECFHMPYVFGIAGVAEEDLTGVESGWGSDCSNFLIHAWRRNGLKLSWGDPRRLRTQLAAKTGNITIRDKPSISPREIERGIAIDFGRHMAAVWEDHEPLGVLDGDDLVVHHLGGFPCIVKLRELAKDRPTFSLLVPRPRDNKCTVKIAGDVVLAGEERVETPGLEKGNAELFLANLEGVPSMRKTVDAPHHDFRFPPQRLDFLKAKGIDAVSLANNHAGDAGREGLLEALQALGQAGIPAVGAGVNVEAACKPWRTQRGGVGIAVFGVSLVECMKASSEQAGCAKLPEHASLLENEIRKANAQGDAVIVMVHGGDEYRTEVNDEQRQWACWLAVRGADFIVGSHPHVIQRTEYFAGAVIVHSLGNAVYPKALKGADSGEIRSFELRSEASTR